MYNKYAIMTRLRETKSYCNTKKNSIMARTDSIIQLTLSCIFDKRSILIQWRDSGRRTHIPTFLIIETIVHT